MISNKKAMSGIVVTLIIIALTLVAVGIVWKVVLPIIQKAAEDVESGGTALTSNCAELGTTRDICTADETCSGTLTVTLDTAYCCVNGTCS